MASHALTIVVPAGTGPLGDAVAQAYRHLVACDLVEPCIWVVDSPGEKPMAAVIGDDEQQPLRSLLEVVAGTEASRLRVVALMLPGDKPAASPDDDLAERVLRAIRDNKASVQEVTHYTLLVPTLDSPPGQPTGPSLDPGLLRGVPWINVVVSPEDRADDGALAVPVSCGPSMPFHAAAALASLTATWMGMGDGPIDQWRRESPEAVATPGAERIVIMRSRSRSLTVPTTADTVPAAVLARRRAWPAPEGTAQARLADDVVGDVQRLFLAGPGKPLQYVAPPPLVVPGPQAITLGALLRMIGRWIRRRLPELAAAEVRSRIISAADGIEDWVSAKVLGTNSAFRVDRRNRTAAEAEALAAEDYLDHLGSIAGSELLRRTPPAEPDVWRALRSWSFSLVDGGPVPDDVTQVLRDGGNQIVVTDPGDLAPPAEDSGWWSPSERIAGALGPVATSLRGCDVWTARRIDEQLYQMASQAQADEHQAQAEKQSRLSALSVLPSPPLSPSAADHATPPDSPESMLAEASLVHDVSDDDVLTAEDYNQGRRTLAAAVADRRRSLMWRIGSGLADAMDTAQAEFDRLVEIIGNPPGDGVLGDLDRKLRRSFVIMIIGLIISVVVPAYLVNAAFSADVATSVAQRLWAIAMMWLLIGTLLSVASYIRRRFQIDHLRTVAITTYEHACDSVGPVLIEVSRLHQCYQQFLDWSEVIGAMVHRPFGPPLAFRGRNHGSWVGGLQAHRVGEGVAGADTMTGLTNAQAAEVFTRSWLANAYSSAESGVTARYSKLTASTSDASDPDRDTTTGVVVDPVAQRSPRVFMREQIADGAPLQDLRVTVMHDVLARLAHETPDKLSDEVNGADPVPWLMAAVPRVDAAPFTAALWTSDGLSEIHGDRIARRSVWIAAGLTEQASSTIVDGVEVHGLQANTSALVSTVVCVDLSNLLQASHLAVFGPDASAPIGDVPVPPQPGSRSTRHLVSFDATGPSVQSLPPVGSLLAPTSMPLPPQLEGSYAFGSLVDGRPCRFADSGPIPWRLRTGVGPLDGADLVTTALQVLADASGLTFRFDGGFEELSQIEEHNGGIWVAFVEPDESHHFTGMAVGGDTLGHARVVFTGDQIVGSRALVGNDPDAAPGFGLGHTLGSVLLHELGHALNLGHVDVATEQMYPFATPESPAWFGPGDLMGLWLLGAGRGAR